MCEERLRKKPQRYLGRRDLGALWLGLSLPFCTQKSAPLNERENPLLLCSETRFVLKNSWVLSVKARILYCFRVRRHKKHDSSLQVVVRIKFAQQHTLLIVQCKFPMLRIPKAEAQPPVANANELPCRQTTRYSHCNLCESQPLSNLDLVNPPHTQELAFYFDSFLDVGSAIYICRIGSHDFCQNDVGSFNFVLLLVHQLTSWSYFSGAFILHTLYMQTEKKGCMLLVCERMRAIKDSLQMIIRLSYRKRQWRFSLIVGR